MPCRAAIFGAGRRLGKPKAHGSSNWNDVHDHVTCERGRRRKMKVETFGEACRGVHVYRATRQDPQELEECPRPPAPAGRAPRQRHRGRM